MHVFQFSQLLISGYVEYVCDGNIVRDNKPGTIWTESRSTNISIEIVVGPYQLAIRQVPELQVKRIAFASGGHEVAVRRKGDGTDNALAGIYRTQEFPAWHIPNDN